MTAASSSSSASGKRDRQSPSPSKPTTHHQQDPPSPKRSKLNDTNNNNTLYLDSIRRPLLDFDFEKVCSISLSNQNVYACLVCGKYFQGKNKSSHAYFHSMDEDHHVFIHLGNLKCFVLPDGYEVNDPSLEDIKYVIRPTYTPALVSTLDHPTKPSYDLTGKAYNPGFIGLNNIKDHDYENVVVQALAHIRDFRDHFLLNELESAPELAKRLSLLIRKLWNPRAFKSQVSPHEFVQQVSLDSNRRFRLETQSDPVEFLTWLLNTLHIQLGGHPKKRGSSLVHKLFQGELRIESQELLEESKGLQGPKLFDTTRAVKISYSPFLVLTLDLPTTPLFQDELEKNIIPQIPLTTLLNKYDGITGTETGTELRKYQITKLPKYLLVHVKRFVKNSFSTEKNHTIVNFALKGLDLREFITPPPPPSTPTTYNLFANIFHDGIIDSKTNTRGTFKVHIWSPRENGTTNGNGQWYEVEDLLVKEVMPEMVPLSECYLQVWERVEV